MFSFKLMVKKRGGGAESNAQERKNMKEAARGRKKNKNRFVLERGSERGRGREKIKCTKTESTAAV